MAIDITIRGIPEKVRTELAKQAATRNQSMQDYLKEHLAGLAASPSNVVWLERVEERKAAFGTRLSAADILDAKDADHR